MTNGRLLGGCAIGALGLFGLFFAFIFMDSARFTAEYEAVAGRVIAITEGCNVRPAGRRNRSGSPRHGSEYTTAPISCDEVRRQRPDDEPLAVRGFRLAYRSPADGRMHEGELYIDRHRVPDVAIGDELPVHVSNADSNRPIYAGEGYRRGVVPLPEAQNSH